MPNQTTLGIIDPEGIDAIIDSVAANPERAERAKTMLRESIAQRKTVLPFSRMVEVANDDDELWDNVPI